MKYGVAYGLLQKLRRDPKLAKRVAIIVAAVAGFAIVALIGLVWVGIAILSPVADSAVSAVSNGEAEQHLAQLAGTVENLESIKPLGCFAAFQSLLAVQPWAENSIETNLMMLKTACLESVNMASEQGSSPPE